MATQPRELIYRPSVSEMPATVSRILTAIRCAQQVAGLLACPLGMYFMMRGMMTKHQEGGAVTERPKKDRHA